MDNVIWTPQPRQFEFMQRPEDEALYGGAAGGGKSDALVIEATRQVHIPHYKALILRKTFPQLTELIEKSQRYYTLAFPKASYNESKHTWTFPSGAKIVFGSMQHTKDKLNYQGKAYDFIAFDELTHFTWEEYSYLSSRNRANGDGTKVYMRATANPGGVGHGWVKDRFITAAEPMHTKWEAVEIEHDGKTETRYKSRIFVPSSVFDNKILLENDPNYLTRLASLPEAEKKALLYGDWDSYSGQVFSEFRNDVTHYDDRRFTHVINPFKPPENWTIYRSFDFGYSKPFSCAWSAIDGDGRIYRILELYGCVKDEPDVGIKWSPEEIFREVARIEHEHEWLKGKRILGVADPAIWDKSHGISIAEHGEKYGIYFEKGKNDRLNGKMQVHYRMRFDESGIPMMYVFSNCKAFIRTIPTLIYDANRPEDIDTKLEDHCYDEFRYLCMENPIKAVEIQPRKPAVYNPLDDDDIKVDRYNFYRTY